MRLTVVTILLLVVIPLTHGLFSSPIGASKKLYDDQRAAWERRSQEEKTLLGIASDLMVPTQSNKVYITPPKGTGFGAKALETAGPLVQAAKAMGKELDSQGVLRVNNCISKSTAAALRLFVLSELESAKADVVAGVSSEQSRFGVELSRKFRADLLLSLLAPVDTIGHPVATALNEILGAKGSLRHLYELLVGKNGLLYELAATVTEPGSDRQQIHPDLPFKETAPLYVVFVALQDISLSMGPTTFIPGSHTKATMNTWNDRSKRDDYLSKAKSVVATLSAGDAVVFDARILHCGNANEGSTRALFNFSFRNSLVTGELGYKGSIRRGYEDKLTLGSLGQLLLEYSDANKKNVKGVRVDNAFMHLGDGLSDMTEGS